MVVSAASLLVFSLFLIFSEINFVGMLLILLVLIVFGFYLNYDVRKMVSSGMYNEG